MNIITLTVNPALDKSAKVDGLIPEQKLSCHSIDIEAGGGGINISRVLSRLNVASQCIFTSGGDNGKQLESLVAKENIDANPISVASITRENLSVTDTQTNHQYRFGMPGGTITASEVEQITTQVFNLLQENDLLALSGSLPPGMPSDFYVQLTKMAKKKNVNVVLDTSGSALKEAINHEVCLVKPNQKELALLAGKEFLTNKEQEKFAKHLVAEKNIKYVVVSMGARGAFMATTDGIFYQRSPSIPVKSTVGAGDSMVAGLIYGMKEGMPAKEMLRYGVACGSATAMSEGTNLASMESIQQTLNLLK
jgi:6-phosphofructokinase 2